MDGTNKQRERPTWRQRGRRFAHELQDVLIGWPTRSDKPWEHQASYEKWLRDNKYPKRVRDFLSYWFAVVFILISVCGGLAVLLHRTLGLP